MVRSTENLPWYLRNESLSDAKAYRGDVYTLDLETTNREYGDSRNPDNRIVVGCLRLPDGTVLFGGVEPASEIGAYLSEAGKAAGNILVAHNAKFELSWLNRVGIPTQEFLVWDTMVGEYVMAGNLRVPLSLHATAHRHGLPGKEPVIDALMDGGVCPSEMPEHLLWARVGRDVETTYKIFVAQHKIMQDSNLLGVMLTRCILTPVLAAIEPEGMALDPARVESEYRKVARDLAEVETALNGMAEGVNFRSPAQLAMFIYDRLGFEELRNKRGEPLRTAGGTRRTDKNTLNELKATTPEQKRFITLRTQYGALNAALTKSLNFFRGVCREYGGVFQANFNQTRTQTHRLSSSGKRIKFSDGTESGVQFQNLPREYKRMFKARDRDYVVVEVDGAQLEFRAAGQLGQDRQVCLDVVHSADIHKFTASVLFNKPESDITKAQRTAAKKHTFKPLYGGQSGTKREVAYYEAFREKYKGVYQTQMGWVAAVLKSPDKCLVMPWGMRFYFPHARMRPDGYVTETPNIFNYPIQSFATADIIPVSLTYLFWYARLSGLRVRIVNTVHDSVVAEVHKDDVEKFRELAIAAFLDSTYEYIERVYGMELNVPLGIGFTAGDHWGEGEELAFSRPYKTVLAQE